MIQKHLNLYFCFPHLYINGGAVEEIQVIGKVGFSILN